MFKLMVFSAILACFSGFMAANGSSLWLGPEILAAMVFGSTAVTIHMDRKA